MTRVGCHRMGVPQRVVRRRRMRIGCCGGGWLGAGAEAEED